MDQPLLSICIPTYNRSDYLRICLQKIFLQTDGFKDQIEIIVSDNASTDNTKDLIGEFTGNGHDFLYTRNEMNLGADKNIGKCFDIAKGKYVWVCSDDDFLIDDAFSKIFHVLMQNDIGVLYLNSYWYEGTLDPLKMQTDGKLNYTVYDESIKFVERVHFWVTFITGNIINKSLIDGKFNFSEYDGTSLVQLGWTLPAIFSTSRNIVIENNIVACKGNNTGGYNLIHVFGHNFNSIMDSLIAKGVDKRIKPVINNKLLADFFPYHINNDNGHFKKESYFKELFPLYWNCRLFWKKIVPIFFENKTETGK